MTIRKSSQKILLVLLLIYAVASLIHFIHNAEFISDYPNLPDSWTTTGVYSVWLGMTIVGVVGWVFVSRGLQFIGLSLLVVYALLGLDSLGHYVLAPISEHTVAMNSTILLEVVAASLVLIEVIRQFAKRISQRNSIQT